MKLFDNITLSVIEFCFSYIQFCYSATFITNKRFNHSMVQIFVSMLFNLHKSKQTKVIQITANDANSLLDSSRTHASWMP